MAQIVCWRSGEAAVTYTIPNGAMFLVSGSASRLRRILSVCARHAYDGQTLLVPGLPEAADDDEALLATAAFRDQLKKRLTKRAARTAAA